jgi:hypothetical protein
MGHKPTHDEPSFNSLARLAPPNTVLRYRGQGLRRGAQLALHGDERLVGGNVRGSPGMEETDLCSSTSFVQQAMTSNEARKCVNYSVLVRDHPEKKLLCSVDDHLHRRSRDNSSNQAYRPLLTLPLIDHHFSEIPSIGGHQNPPS